ncbi:restriction endonuclease subunit S [Pediococcus pentosaceus]|uniref:restriction endonuclease subunit S n=1 Tax=Pediococcus pentosaceus TaxID=1255 RepID=UPI0018A1502A|nr:restriction endonuclease subunit S [Pediococcus pentosaceus]MBF7140660.1 restriction endonuclease subunit S [Pediococcus pentosaceus]
MSNKVPQIRFNGYSDAWEERKLGDITTWTKGQGLPKEYLNNERYGSEAVHYADLYKFSPVMQEVIHWTNSDDGRIIPDNSLLFPASDVTPVGLARTSTLRLSGVKAGGDVIIGQLSERINSSFMSYQINANSKKILPLITGTTVKHVQAKSLATMSVTITNMAEQTAISGLFERIDNLIALHQRKLDLLKEQKKGYLQKMFPKNGEKVPELRFAGSADAWEERKLKDVVEKQIKGKAQFEKLAPGEVEYLDTSRLNGGQAILTNGLKDVTLDDILILWDGSKAGTVYHGFEGALGSTLKAYRTSANSKFVYQYLKRHQDNIYNNYRTPNIPHVQKDFLNVFTISVPVSDEQEKIGSFFKQLDDTIDLHQRKLDLLKEQKKGFLQNMFV